LKAKRGSEQYHTTKSSMADRTFVGHSWMLGYLGPSILTVQDQAAPEPASVISSSFEIMTSATASLTVAAKNAAEPQPWCVIRDLSQRVLTGSLVIASGCPETLVLYRKRAGEKAIGQREGPIGALSIQPSEGSRDTYAVAYGF
jgi:hypothetical protein